MGWSLEPVTWALRDHVLGIDRPCAGHWLPVSWALSAQRLGLFFGHYISKLRCIYALKLNGAKCCYPFFSSSIYSFGKMPNSFLKHLEKYFGVLKPTWVATSLIRMLGFDRMMR